MDERESEQELDITELDPDELVAYRFVQTLEALDAAKPNDRSGTDRRYAITITELEKVRAYFDFYIFRGDTHEQLSDSLLSEPLHPTPDLSIPQTDQGPPALRKP